MSRATVPPGAGKSPIPSLTSWQMTVSASEAGAARPGGAWPWAVLLALTCAGVYLALRPPLFHRDGYVYRLWALKPDPFYNANPHHLLWNEVQIGLVHLGEAVGLSDTVPFQLFGILANTATLFFFFLLLARASGQAGFAVGATLLVAFSPKFWFMGFQNQPYVLVFPAVVGFLGAWAGPQGRLASTPQLLAAGLAVTAATVFHQAAALLAAAGCGALLLSERGPWGRRLLRSAAFGAGIAATVLLAYVTMGAALGFRSPTALWGWMTTYLETQHGLQFRFPESLAQTVMGLVRTGVQVERLEWTLARHLPPTAILYLYLALGGVSAFVAALFASQPLMRARLRALWPDEPLFVVSVLSVLVWGAFCVGWEPITYYWVVALFPGLVALGLLLRGRPRAIRVFLAASVALAAWNVRFNHDWDRIYARNFPEPLADAIEAQLGPGDLIVVLGNRDWYGNMDYDLLFRLLEHRGETRNVAILNDLVMNKAAERPWAEALRERIERSLNAGARVFVATHVLNPAQYADLTDAGSPFAAYAKEQYAGLDGPTLHRQVEQVFAHYGLVPSDLRVGLDPYLELRRR
jgi:hypothetical protein